ncbi:MAG: cytochrome C [Deltaproteobacteria bacterium]|nr:cytochrome C [Deltaproteobacteria bacterium]
MAEPHRTPEEKIIPASSLNPDKIHTWPHLVRVEFIVGLLSLIFLTVWSIVIDAPLEEPANPTKTPNPSKAPWYFLGLQEMLVYFDPWIAGVVLPGLIIVGLMVIPYIDINPKGSGYYTFRERKFAVGMYCFGFLILWIALIVVGVFLRGPGWNFFAPWEAWDPHKVVALTNVDLNMWLAQTFGLDILRNQAVAALFGLGLIGAYYSLGVLFYSMKVKTNETLQKLGVVRYGIVAFLFLTMMALPIKMVLRWTLNIKYICVIPWFNLNF